MDDANKVPLPEPHTTYDDGNWLIKYTEGQMLEYGEACARAALAAVLQEADAVVEKLRALHRATRCYEDACVLRGAELCADDIRSAAPEIDARRAAQRP